MVYGGRNTNRPLASCSSNGSDCMMDWIQLSAFEFDRSVSDHMHAMCSSGVGSKNSEVLNLVLRTSSTGIECITTYARRAPQPKKYSESRTWGSVALSRCTTTHQLYTASDMHNYIQPKSICIITSHSRRPPPPRAPAPRQLRARRRLG